jgi:hypothetical protein
LHFFQTGVAFCSDYTGVWGDKEGIGMVAAVLAAECNIAPESFDLAWTRACDIDPAVQKFLLHIAEASSPSSACIFGDILDRLPAKARAWIEAALPDSSAPLAVRQKALASISAWLWENRSWIFTQDCTSACLTHGHACMVSSRAQANMLRGGVKRKTADSSLASNICGGKRSFVVNTAGTSCTGWTRAGDQRRFSDLTEVPHAVWSAERAAHAELMLEDMFFQENADTYPWREKLAAPLASTHAILQVYFGPQVGGYPVRRSRSFVAGLNLKSLIWVGPDQEYLQGHFEAFFKNDVTGCSDDWLVAPQNLIDQDLVRRAKVRGACPPVEALKALQVQEPAEFRRRILPPGRFLNFRQYDSRRDLAAPSWAADLEQDALRGKSTAGSILPAQLTHGTTWSWSANRPFLASDVMTAHGFRLFDVGSGSPVSGLADYLLKLPPNTLQSFCGNGFHLPSITSWMLYVFAHTIPVEKASQVRPEVSMLQRGASFSLGEGSDLPSSSSRLD